MESNKIPATEFKHEVTFDLNAPCKNTELLFESLFKGEWFYVRNDGEVVKFNPDEARRP